MPDAGKENPDASVAKPSATIGSARASDDLLADGLERARDMGAEPIVVVNGHIPSNMPDVDTIIVVRDLMSEVAEASSRPDADCPQSEPKPKILVFPGTEDHLHTAITAKRLLGCNSALVFEEGAWRKIDLRLNMLLAASTVPRGENLRAKGRLWLTYDQHARVVAQRLYSNHHARRVQPFVDRREGAVVAALRNADGFPYRMASVAENRVLLGIGQLGGGGAERQIVNTAEGLSKRGLDVHILVTNPIEDFNQYADKAARACIRVHDAEAKDISAHPWLAAHPEWHELLSHDLMNRIFAAAKVIHKVRPAVVQTSLDWTNIVVGMAAVLCGVPHVFMSGRNLAPHHFEFFQWFMYPCYRALLGHPGVHMTNNSEAGRDSYARWLRVPPASIQVIRNGLQTSEFRLAESRSRKRIREELAVGPVTPVVLGAFRLSAEKRPLLWLEAAAHVRRQLPDAVFLLCGSGNMADEVKAKAAALGLSESLKLLGARADIFDLYSASDLVLQTALQEGTPNTLIEAQAVGVPVVTTRAFGAAEAVANDRTGIVVGRDTAAALATAVLAILRDQVFRERVRTEGPRWIAERFGFERMIDDTLIAYADAGVPWAAERLPEEKRYFARAQLWNPIHDGGFCWRAACPSLQAYAGTMQDPNRSPAMLLEDGRPLGPPHAEHVSIRSAGGGCFSHWTGNVYFSASDNTSPVDNGRRYELVIPRGWSHRR